MTFLSCWIVLAELLLCAELLGILGCTSATVQAGQTSDVVTGQEISDEVALWFRKQRVLDCPLYFSYALQSGFGIRSRQIEPTAGASVRFRQPPELGIWTLEGNSLPSRDTIFRDKLIGERYLAYDQRNRTLVFRFDDKDGFSQGFLGDVTSPVIRIPAIALEELARTGPRSGRLKVLASELPSKELVYALYGRPRAPHTVCGYTEAAYFEAHPNGLMSKFPDVIFLFSRSGKIVGLIVSFVSA